MIDSKVTNIKNISKKNLPYIITWILYYAWVIVFTTWWTASPLTDEVYGTDSRVILHSLNLLSSAIVVFFMKKQWFKKFSIIGGFLIIISSILFALTKDPTFLGATAHLIVTVILACSLGIVNGGILVPFVYVMNNTEKFYSVVGTNLLISLLVLFQELEFLNISNGFIFSFVMLVLSLIPIFFFKVSDYKKKEKEHENYIVKTPKILYITLVLNCLYVIFCKGVGKSFLLLANETVTFNLGIIFYIGGIIGCIIYFIIYHFFKQSNHATWNITFATFALSMFIYYIADTFLLKCIFSFFVGIGSTIGMINMYYILGVIGRKYWNHTYIKASIFFIGVCGGASGTLLGNHLTLANDANLSMIFSIISLVIVLILLSISPTLALTYYQDKWHEDSTKGQVDIKDIRKFQKYNLTDREIEVANCLIDNYTNRQIAATLGISENTVKSHCKNIFKKMDIYSKNEIAKKIQ